MESKFPLILEELMALRGQTAFSPYRAPSSASAQPAADGVGSVRYYCVELLILAYSNH